MDAAQFRLDFPEFADATAYPASGINFWLGVAAKLLRPEAWVDVIDIGYELFTAHNLALEKAAAQGGAGGAAPGMNIGVVASKTVDKLSITYNSTAGLVPDAGHWNLTTYGTRFLWLLNMAGMGPTQLGAGIVWYAGSPWSYGGAYGPGWPFYATH